MKTQKFEILKVNNEVKVTKDRHNASDFNIGKLNILGIYSIDNWEDKIFKIEGTVKLITFKHTDEIFGAYLLKLDGKKIGYVYNNAIELISK